MGALVAARESLSWVRLPRASVFGSIAWLDSQRLRRLARGGPVASVPEIAPLRKHWRNMPGLSDAPGCRGRGSGDDPGSTGAVFLMRDRLDSSKASCAAGPARRTPPKLP